MASDPSDAPPANAGLAEAVHSDGGSFLVEPARDEDFEAVEVLFDECFRTLEPEGTRGDRVRLLREQLGSGGGVARAEGRIVGFGTVVRPPSPVGIAQCQTVLYPLLAFHADGFGDDVARRLDVCGSADWVHFVAGAWGATALGVDRAWRRAGVGRALVRARVEAARTEGARAFFVDCVAGSGSVELYRSLGFEEIFRLRSFYVGGQDLICLGLRLGAPCREPILLRFPVDLEARARWRRRLAVVVFVLVVALAGLALYLKAPLGWTVMGGVWCVAAVTSFGIGMQPKGREISFLGWDPKRARLSAP